MSKKQIVNQDGKLVAVDPDTGETEPVEFESASIEEVQNTKDHATIDISHTRYVGPDDPAGIDKFDVQNGDVWIETGDDS